MITTCSIISKIKIKIKQQAICLQAEIRALFLQVFTRKWIKVTDRDNEIFKLFCEKQTVQVKIFLWHRRLRLLFTHIDIIFTFLFHYTNHNLCSMLQAWKRSESTRESLKSECNSFETPLVCQISRIAPVLKLIERILFTNYTGKWNWNVAKYFQIDSWCHIHNTFTIVLLIIIFSVSAVFIHKSDSLEQK